MLLNTSILIQRNLEIPGTVPGLSFIQYRKCATKNLSFFLSLEREGEKGEVEIWLQYLRAG